MVKRSWEVSGYSLSGLEMRCAAIWMVTQVSWQLWIMPLQAMDGFSGKDTHHFRHGNTDARESSLPEIPSALELLSFQQVRDRLLTNDDLVGQRSPGNIYVSTAVSLRTGIRVPGALAPGDGHATIGTQASVRRC